MINLTEGLLPCPKCQYEQPEMTQAGRTFFINCPACGHMLHLKGVPSGLAANIWNLRRENHD